MHVGVVAENRAMLCKYNEFILFSVLIVEDMDSMMENEDLMVRDEVECELK